jgi:metacaspase-1
MAKGRSLHIGVNAVDPAHYAGWTGELIACEADAEDMAALATARGFTASRLLTKDATRARVTKAVGEALNNLGDGDIFLLTYAGHGGQIPDLNDDAPDRADETWCLYDGELLDDEIYQLLAGFAEGVRVLVIADCCHSGTNIRAVRSLASSPTTRTLVDPNTDPNAPVPALRLLPPDVALRTFRQNREFYTRIQGPPSKEKAADAVRASVRLLSGCQDNQVSLDGTFNGLFTSILLKVWKEGAFKGDYADFHRAIVDRMPLTQVPNHLRVGAFDTAYDRQVPFTI